MPLSGDQVVEALPGLWRYALALTHDPTAAEDLVQEVAVRALERADSFRGEASPATWLHRLMFHRYVDEQRRRRPDLVDDETLAHLVEAAGATTPTPSTPRPCCCAPRRARTSMTP